MSAAGRRQHQSRESAGRCAGNEKFCFFFLPEDFEIVSVFFQNIPDYIREGFHADGF